MKDREEIHQILKLGKGMKNKYRSLLFIELSMIEFSKLSKYIRKLEQENAELKKQQEEFVIYLQNKKYDYAEDNFSKDDLFNEVQEILEKYNEVTGVFDRWEKEVSSALDEDIENFFKEFYDPMNKTTN